MNAWLPESEQIHHVRMQLLTLSNRVREHVTTDPLLVYAPSAAADAAAARVIRNLRGVRASGVGGDALAQAGCNLNVPSLLLTRATLTPPRAALVCFAPEWMRSAGVALAMRGTRVLMYGGAEALTDLYAPVPARERIALALTMPDEEAAWRQRGFDARYVGHPASEITRLSRADARGVLSLTAAAAAVAISPGSRSHELRANLPVMLAAFDDVRDRYGAVDARVLLAANLQRRDRAWAESAAAAAGIPTHTVHAEYGVGPLMSAFDVALCGPGTASLEAALGGAAPVILVPSRGRMQRALGTPQPVLSLPNRITSAPLFAEVERDELAAANASERVLNVLDESAEFAHATQRVAEALGEQRPREVVATWLSTWL